MADRSAMERFLADLEELEKLGLDEDLSDEEEGLLGSICEDYVESLNRGEVVEKPVLVEKCPEHLRQEASRLLNTIDLLRKKPVAEAMARDE